MSNASARVCAWAPDGVEVTLSDHSFQRVARVDGSLDEDVAPGLYTVRFVAGTTVHQEVVTAPAGETVIIPTPDLGFRSPVPLTAAPLATDAQAAAARQLSHQVHRKLGHGAQLLVFVRDQDRLGRRSPLVGLSLHDRDGTPLLELDDAGQGVTLDRSQPLWAGLTMELDPGAYRLRTRTGVGTLEQLVVLTLGWQTQIFLVRRSYGGRHEGRAADLGDATMLMSRIGSGFDPHPEASGLRLTELARQALSSGRAAVAGRDLRNMLFSKYDNPMLGLYGAHVLLMQPEPDLELLARVLSNLERLVPGLADIAALRVWLDPDRASPFELPPMLRRSWQIIVEATSTRPELVPAQSLAGHVSESVYGSTTWLIWHVRPVRHRAGKPVLEQRVTDVPLEALLQTVASALPPHSERAAAFAGLDALSRDIASYAGHRPASSAPSETRHAETQLVKAFGVPRSVLEDRLIDVAERFDGWL